MSQWKTPKLKRLAQALVSLETEDEMLSFLRDVGTLRELRELANRWGAVLDLDAGKNYRDIAEDAGISTSTVTRIAHWLRHGEGGYRAALKRLKNKRPHSRP